MRVTETGPNKAAQGKWGVEDLRERPAPMASAAGQIEWIRLEAGNASLGTSLTAIALSQAGGANYDAATFSVNGSGNLEILRGGVYVVEVHSYGWVLAPNVDSVLFQRLVRQSGPTPESSGANNFATLLAYSGTLLRANRLSQDFTTTPLSEMETTLAYADSATASELQLEAYVEENETGVAHTEPEFVMFVTRLGDAYVA